MRTTSTPLGRLVLSVLATLIFVPLAPAQTLTQKKDLLSQVLNAFSQVPDAQKRTLSSGGQNFFALATQLTAGRDQFFPSVAVDRGGHVGVCYYDRRGSADNTVIDRFCSLSVNHGRSWSEQRVSFSNWLPIHDADALINTAYIGDYDALTSDTLGLNSGFVGAFEIQNQGNPDVFANRF